MKAEIDGLVAEHDIFWSRGQIGFTEFPPGEREKYPPSPQRLVRLHPGSQRKTLYLSAHASHIRGWPVAEGRLLLWDLTAHATHNQFVYSHRWRVGDVVIWDNRCTMHRGRPHDESQPRDLRRATTLDTGSTLEQAAKPGGVSVMGQAWNPEQRSGGGIAERRAEAVAKTIVFVFLCVELPWAMRSGRSWRSFPRGHHLPAWLPTPGQGDDCHARGDLLEPPRCSRISFGPCSSRHRFRGNGYLAPGATRQNAPVGRSMGARAAPASADGVCGSWGLELRARARRGRSRAFP
jgi:hypothetical protein